MKPFERMFGVIDQKRATFIMEEMIAELDAQRNILRKRAIEEQMIDGADYKKVLNDLNLQLSSNYEKEMIVRELIDRLKR
jgi:hypothetical protein